MKKAILVILIPFLLVAAVGLGVYTWDHGALPGMRPTIVDVTVDTISRDNRGVRITGTAHFAARLKQQAEGSDEVWSLFPLMATGDTTSRTIKVMIRTHYQPDNLYTFEDMTVEGYARPPGRLVPRYAQEAIMAKGYGFTDDFVVIEVYED